MMAMGNSSSSGHVRSAATNSSYDEASFDSFFLPAGGVSHPSVTHFIVISSG